MKIQKKYRQIQIQVFQQLLKLPDVPGHCQSIVCTFPPKCNQCDHISPTVKNLNKHKSWEYSGHS